MPIHFVSCMPSLRFLPITPSCLRNMHCDGIGGPAGWHLLLSREMWFFYSFFVCKVVSNFANFEEEKRDRVCFSVCLRVCVCVSPSQAIPRKLFKSSSSRLDTLAVWVTRTHRVLIILTLTFIQGHADINHEHNTCLIISETIQAMPCITFAVNIVRVKAYIIIIFSVRWPCSLFTQDHQCASNLTSA